MPATAAQFNAISGSQLPAPGRGSRPSPSWATLVITSMSVLALSAAPALAQETREGQKAAERAEKATNLGSYEPNMLERRIQKLDGLLSSNRPIFVAMGSGFDGAGLSLGPGYRARFGDTGSMDAKATWSIRDYRAAEATLRLPSVADDHLVFDVHGSWINAPKVAFFGVGAESTKADRSDFEYRSKAAGVGATFNATKKIRFGASLDALHVEGRAVANVATALDPTYRKTTVKAEFDSRPSPDYARHGSLARVELADYHQTNLGANSFRRVDAEVQQLVPLMRENWILAFRGLVSTTDSAEGNEVPYFMMPSLGGNNQLRGYSSWRFRDRNRMLLTGEYRWTAGPMVDMALFVDAGKVAARRADLNFNDLKFSQGIGMRIHTPSTTVMRIEFARSREGKSLILSFSPSF